jgi:hypothetical protein
MNSIEFKFLSEVWIYPGKAAWYFVTLPEDIAAEIKFFTGKKIGFGTIRVFARIGNTSWKTSIFPDSKSNSYLLPIKADVRKKENTIGNRKATVKIYLGPL